MPPARSAPARVRRAALGLALVAACQPAPAPLSPPPKDDGPRLVIDVRPPEAFAAGHLPGALNIQLGWRQLAERIEAYVPDRDTPLAVRAGDEEEAAKAGGILRRLGYRDVTSPGGGTERDTERLWTAAELAERLGRPDAPVVLDVREPREHRRGTIPGAVLVDPDGGPAAVRDLPRDRAYAVICDRGWRSSQLQSWMEREGFHDVVNVIDGMRAWYAQH